MLSSEDVAAVNILSRLKESYGFKERGSEKIYSWNWVDLVVVDEPILYADKAVASVKADMIVVISKHVSEGGRRCLLVHSTGNWGEKTVYGGMPYTLSMTSAQLVYKAVHACKAAVENNRLKDVEVGIEATHHGPYSEKPLIFVELGSGEKDWKDLKMAETAAEACVEIFRQNIKSPSNNAIGFGGGHYARDVLKVILSEEMAVGHIASKYHFPLPERMVVQAVEKTLEKPSKALVDWDGLRSEHREALVKVLKEIGVEVVRV